MEAIKKHRGKVEYELKNYLGNVLTVITDRRKPVYTSNVFQHYEAFEKCSQDYFSFGAVHRSQSNPSANQNAYRFAFNGKEKSHRTGPQTNYDYSLSRIGGSFRIYNAGVARFLSVDPLTKSYPELTPYQFASNTPIQAIDLDGLEAWKATYSHYGNSTSIKMTFHEELEDINQVYEEHNYYDDYSDLPVTTRTTTQSLDKYPKYFPNGGRNGRIDRKPLITVHGHGGLVFGEVAAKTKTTLGSVGFEFGADGNIISLDASTNEGAKINGPSTDLNVGGGVALIVGAEYRQKFVDGQPTDENELSFTSPGVELSGDPNQIDAPSLKLGIPEYKLALGFGFKVGLFLSINPQPTLSSYERILNDARNKKQSEFQEQSQTKQP